FAGASIVFVNAFTDLGTPLIFDFRATVPAQIFNTSSEAATNPVGYALVALTLALVSGLFLLGKKFGDSGSYAMMSRSATIDSMRELKGARGWLSSVFVMLIIGLAVLPHLGVILSSIACNWFFIVLSPQLG